MMVRFAKKTTDSGKAEKAGIEEAKKMGLKMTVEKHGNTTCSTVIGNSRTPAYISSCIVDKGGVIVGVEVTSPSEAKMVPTAKLRLLVEKAASRL